MQKNGFEYLFRFPGLNKVVQKEVRFIWNLNDKGIIVLLDDRFTLQENQQYFPREWEDASICQVDGIHQKLTEFWEETQ